MAAESHVNVELSDLEPFEPDLKPTPSLTGPMATPPSTETAQMLQDVAEQFLLERKYVRQKDLLVTHLISSNIIYSIIYLSMMSSIIPI